MQNINKIIMVVQIVQVMVISFFTKSKESQMDLVNSNIKQNNNIMMDLKNDKNIHFLNQIISKILYI